MVLSLVALHVVAASVAFAGSRRLGRAAWMAAAAAPASTLAWAIANTREILSGRPTTGGAEWVPSLGVSAATRVDELSLLMIYVTATVGLAAIVYSRSYAAPHRVGLLSGGLTVFAGAMLGLVAADDVFLLWVFWELTTVISFALIAFDRERSEARRAATRALVTNSAGGLAMLAGLVMTVTRSGTSLMSEMSGAVSPLAGGLILAGIAAKSAQVPFQSWLPSAMVAPTPVSAYLHAAAMVKAGPYLVLRLIPLVAGAAFWTPAVVVVGLVGAVYGGVRAMQVDDLKEILAHTTTAEVGLMLAFAGIGTSEAVAAALVLLVAHACFKASLFMVAGTIDHHLGTRDLRRLGGVGRIVPGAGATGAVALVSMAGVPPSIGFVAEDEGFRALESAHIGAPALVLAGVVVATVLKASVSGRLALATSRSPAARGDVSAGAGAWSIAPAATLAGAGLALGLVLTPVDAVVDGVVGTLVSGASGVELALWHGFGPAVGWSMGTLLVGMAAAVWVRSWGRLPGSPFSGAGAERIWRAIERWADPSRWSRSAMTMTVAAGVAVASLGAVWPLVGDLRSRGEDVVVVAVALLICVAAPAVAMIRRRPAQALLVSATGLGMTITYFLLGAHDLAMTQLLVETLVLVVLLAVAWRLRDRAQGASRPTSIARIAVASAAGLGITAAVAMAATVEPATVSTFYETRAMTGVEIPSVVSAILGDFRALDTLGELTVVVAATIAILVLFPWSRERGTEPVLTGRRSAVLTVTVEAMYPAVLLFAVFVLLNGHTGIGGGFPAGLIASVALVLRHAAHEPQILEDRPHLPTRVIGVGLVVAALISAVSGLAGTALLENREVATSIPLLGELSLSTSLTFEVAIAAAVAGLGLTVLGRVDRRGL